MKLMQILKTWMLAGLVAIFISACATSTEEEIADGAPVDSGTTDSGVIASGTGDGSDSGAETSGLETGDSGDGTALPDTSSMTAAEVLAETEGDIANRTIYFEYDSAKLTSESISLLETHGNFIAGNGEVKVRLEGHADERGSREYNIALGDRRAQSVRRVLLFQGASTDQLETVSYGEEKPAVEGHDESAWSKNRRVELIYTVN